MSAKNAAALNPKAANNEREPLRTSTLNLKITRDSDGTAGKMRRYNKRLSMAVTMSTLYVLATSHTTGLGQPGVQITLLYRGMSFYGLGEIILQSGHHREPHCAQAQCAYPAERRRTM